MRTLGEETGQLHPLRTIESGAYLALEWLRFPASNAGDMGSVLGQGMKMPHATWLGQKKKIKLINFLSKILVKKKNHNWVSPTSVMSGEAVLAQRPSGCVSRPL